MAKGFQRPCEAGGSIKPRAERGLASEALVKCLLEASAREAGDRNTGLTRDGWRPFSRALINRPRQT